MEDRKVPVIRKKRTRPGSSKKVLLLLLLFFISIFTILFFHSSLSKVSSVQIEGNRFIATGEIRQTAGVFAGDSFFGVNPGVVEKKVLQLKLAESVKVTKKFPGLVRIEVKEYPHVAFQQKNEQWQAVLANGAGIPLESIPVPDKPILTGWEGHEALKLELCRTLAEIPNDRLSDVSEILPDPSSSYEDRILFYSRSSFVVTTTVGKLPEKLGYFHEIVEDLRDRGIASGKLILLEADHYVPFADMGPGTE